MSRTRRLAAVLAADVAGYSRLIGADEAGTLAAFKTIKADLFDPTLAAHHGRLVKTTGDGFLAEFSSVVDALHCATEVQAQMAERNATVSTDKRIDFRIGINVGDIVVEDGDIFGDGVNVAVRLEGVAEPGGICVSARVQEDAAGKLNLCFDDIGEQQLKNIARPVRVYRVRDVATAKTQSAPELPALPLPDKPSIAVLPFINMSGDPDQEFFADGIAEDIITALSRYSSLFVIARNSCFTYKERAIDVKHVWAERYDRDLADIFALQDEITGAVTIAIAPAIAHAERKRAMRTAPGSLDAWTAYQRGLWHVFKISREDDALAQKYFQQAIDIDPAFAGGYKGLAVAYLQAATLFHTRSPADAYRSAEALARQAIALDGTDAEAHSTLATAMLRHGDYDGALAQAEIALAMSPNLALAQGTLGEALIFSGQPKKGLVAVRTSIRLDPHDPKLANRLNNLALGYYFYREYEAAAEAARRAVRSNPEYPLPYRWLAAALGQLGRTVEAKEALEKAIAIAPATFDMYVRQRVPWHRPEDYAHMLEGLRKAGWKDQAASVLEAR